MQDQFDQQDIQDILHGAHLYASGGGGALENGEQMLKEIEACFPDQPISIDYIDPSNFDDTRYAAVMAAMGAPQSFLALGFGQSPVRAFEDHQHQMALKTDTPNFTFGGVIPVESGVIAHAMCLLVAAKLKIPIVDGDGGGRAFPSLQMATFANSLGQSPVPLSPAILCSEESISEDGTTINFTQNEPATVDLLTRAIISCGVGFKNRASLSCFAMNGKTLKEKNKLVANTLTHCRDLGAAIRRAKDAQKDAVSAAIEHTNGVKLFEGTLTDVSTITSDGFDLLTVTINNNDKNLTILAKNENMLAWTDSQSSPVAMAPDVIGYMDSNGAVLGNSELATQFSEGKRPYLYIIGIPAAKAIDNDYFISEFQKVFEKIGYFGRYQSLRETSL